MTFKHPEDRSDEILDTVDEFIGQNGEVSFQAQSLTPTIDYVVVSKSLKRDGFWSAEWYDEKGPVHTIELSNYHDLLKELLSNVDVNLNTATFVANAEELESDEAKREKVGKMLDYANNNEGSITRALQEALEDFECDNKFGDEAYVFDFDDTLVKTNSKIKVMMGNEVVKELTTHQFSEYTPEAGETLDFSEFHKVVDPKPLKTMKKLIEIDSCISDGTSDAKIYILTARSSESRFAIFEYLRDSGVGNISEKSIITVGDNANDAEKAAIDKAKILEQIKGFHRGNVTFVDDSKMNVEAAKNVDGIDVEHVAGEVERMIKEGSADTENLVAKRIHTSIDKPTTAAMVSEIKGLSKSDMMLFLNTIAYKLLGMSPDNPVVDLNSTLQVVGNLMEKGNVASAFIYDLFNRFQMKIPQVDSDTLIANTVTSFFALSKIFERDNLMAEEIVYLSESILDEPLDRLSPKIWDEGEEPNVLPEVKKFIMDGLREVIGDAVPTRVYFVGSLTGKRYTEKSDADISVVVDADEEELEKMKAKARKVNGRFPIGTTHPVNYFMLNNDLELDRFDSVYDLENDKWLKSSKDFGVDFFAVYDDFVEFVSGLDIEKGEAFRSIIDIKILQKALENGGNVEITMNKISQRLNDLNGAIQNLSKEFDNISKDRVDAFMSYEDGEKRDLPSPNLLPENIRYKLLERFHYLSLMKNIKKLIEKTGDIDTFKDIKDVSNVMSNAVTPNLHDSVIDEDLDSFTSFMEDKIEHLEVFEYDIPSADSLKKKYPILEGLSIDPLVCKWLMGQLREAIDLDDDTKAKLKEIIEIGLDDQDEDLSFGPMFDENERTVFDFGFKDIEPLNVHGDVAWQLWDHPKGPFLAIDYKGGFASKVEDIRKELSQLNLPRDNIAIKIIEKIEAAYNPPTNVTGETMRIYNLLQKHIASGFFQPNQVGKRKVKIGKLLKDEPELKKKFDGRLSGSTKKQDLVVVFTHNAEDIALASTGRGWTSCADIKTNFGRYAAAQLPNKIAGGGLVVYLTTKDDKKIESPTARISIRRFIDHESGSFALVPEDECYGVGGRVQGAFQRFVADKLRESNKYTVNTDFAIFEDGEGGYSDTFNDGFLALGKGGEGSSADMGDFLQKRLEKEDYNTVSRMLDRMIDQADEHVDYNIVGEVVEELLDKAIEKNDETAVDLIVDAGARRLMGRTDVIDLFRENVDATDLKHGIIETLGNNGLYFPSFFDIVFWMKRIVGGTSGRDDGKLFPDVNADKVRADIDRIWTVMNLESASDFLDMEHHLGELEDGDEEVLRNWFMFTGASKFTGDAEENMDFLVKTGMIDADDVKNIERDKEKMKQFKKYVKDLRRVVHKEVVRRVGVDVRDRPQKKAPWDIIDINENMIDAIRGSFSLEDEEGREEVKEKFGLEFDDDGDWVDPMAGKEFEEGTNHKALPDELLVEYFDLGDCVLDEVTRRWFSDAMILNEAIDLDPQIEAIVDAEIKKGLEKRDFTFKKRKGKRLEDIESTLSFGPLFPDERNYFELKGVKNKHKKVIPTPMKIISALALHPKGPYYAFSYRDGKAIHADTLGKMNGNIKGLVTKTVPNLLNSDLPDPPIGNTLGFIRDEYNNRTPEDIEKLRRVGIGKLLKNDPELKKAFEERLGGGLKDSGGLVVVFTHNPKDIALSSTGRGWTSCADLATGPADGLARGQIKNKIGGGGMVVYLTTKDDKNIESPIARIAIRRFIDRKTGSFALLPEKKCYGAKDIHFEKFVKDTLQKSNEETADVPFSIFVDAEGGYSDTFRSGIASISRGRQGTNDLVSVIRTLTGQKKYKEATKLIVQMIMLSNDWGGEGGSPPFTKPRVMEEMAIFVLKLLKNNDKPNQKQMEALRTVMEHWGDIESDMEESLGDVLDSWLTKDPSFDLIKRLPSELLISLVESGLLTPTVEVFEQMLDSALHSIGELNLSSKEKEGEIRDPVLFKDMVEKIGRMLMILSDAANISRNIDSSDDVFEAADSDDDLAWKWAKLRDFLNELLPEVSAERDRFRDGGDLDRGTKAKDPRQQKMMDIIDSMKVGKNDNVKKNNIVSFDIDSRRFLREIDGYLGSFNDSNILKHTKGKTPEDTRKEDAELERFLNSIKMTEEKGKFNNERPLKPIEHPNKDCKDKKKENDERFKDSFDRWNKKATLKIKDNNGAKPEDYKGRNSQKVEEIDQAESLDEFIDMVEGCMGVDNKTEFSAGKPNKQKKASREGYRVDKGSKGAVNVRRMGAKEQLRRKIAAMKGHAKTPASSKATKEKKRVGMELNPETKKQRQKARKDSHKIPPKVVVKVRRKKLRQKLKEND